MTDTIFYVTLNRRVAVKKWTHYDKVRYTISIPDAKGRLQQYAKTGSLHAALTCAHKVDTRYACESLANPAS